MSTNNSLRKNNCGISNNFAIVAQKVQKSNPAKKLQCPGIVAPMTGLALTFFLLILGVNQQEQQPNQLLRHPQQQTSPILLNVEWPEQYILHCCKKCTSQYQYSALTKNKNFQNFLWTHLTTTILSINGAAVANAFTPTVGTAKPENEFGKNCFMKIWAFALVPLLESKSFATPCQYWHQECLVETLYAPLYLHIHIPQV